MTKVTILGSGSAYGVPTIGGDWGDCDSMEPRNKRTAASILLETTSGEKYLVDMGPDIKEQSLRHNIRDINGVLFTHGHADHIAGCFHLPKFMKVFSNDYSNNLPMYATRKTRQDIEKMWWFQNDPDINVEYSGEGRPYWIEMLHGQDVNSIGFWDVIIPFEQNHGKITSMGFRCVDLVYSTDVRDFPNKSRKYLKNIDTWIIDCNCLEPTEMHGDLDSVIKLYDKYKPKRMVLTHLDETMDYKTVTEKIQSLRKKRNIELAYDGMVIEVE